MQTWVPKEDRARTGRPLLSGSLTLMFVCGKDTSQDTHCLLLWRTLNLVTSSLDEQGWSCRNVPVLPLMAFLQGVVKTSTLLTLICWAMQANALVTGGVILVLGCLRQLGILLGARWCFWWCRLNPWWASLSALLGRPRWYCCEKHYPQLRMSIWSLVRDSELCFNLHLQLRGSLPEVIWGDM